MASQKTYAELTDILIRVINQAAQIEHMPVDLGQGEKLSPSEIHIIDIAGRFPEENLKSIATRLGVTKGAISQMVKKLEEKKFLHRKKGEDNKKTVFIELTESGKTVFNWHSNLHNRIYADFQEELCIVHDEDLITTIEILKKYEQILIHSIRIRDLQSLVKDKGRIL